MDGNLVRLRDFAAANGVTERTMQKHLRKLETELAGHYDRRGPAGTWIDETAQQMILSKLQRSLPAVVDTGVLEENARLKDELWSVQQKCVGLQTEVLNQRQLLMEANNAAKQLEAANTRVDELEGRVLQETERANVAENKISEMEKELRELRDSSARVEKELAEEQSRKLSWKERLFGHK